MGPATHDDLYANYLSYHQELASRLMELRAPALSLDENLATNLMYGAAVCRLCYYRQPEALPEAGDLEGQAGVFHIGRSAIVVRLQDLAICGVDGQVGVEVTR